MGALPGKRADGVDLPPGPLGHVRGAIVIPRQPGRKSLSGGQMTVVQPIETMQRAKGEALVTLDADRLVRLRTEGSAKAILPEGAQGREVVFLNTSGGLTSGDRLRFGLEMSGRAVGDDPDGRTRLSRPTAGLARVDVRLEVGAGGWLDWLPQETILFDRAALDRRTVIDLAAGAGCLALEAVVLGRAAMGETVRRVRFRDRREIRVGGRAVLDRTAALWTMRRCRRGAAVLGQARGPLPAS